MQDPTFVYPASSSKVKDFRQTTNDNFAVASTSIGNRVAVFKNVSSVNALTSLTEATQGDEAVLTDQTVYKLVATNPAFLSSWSEITNFGTGTKPSVRACVDTVNISLTAPGASIGGVTFSNPGVDDFLLVAQTDGTKNGIYVWNGPTSAPTRRSDANTSSKMTPGFLIAVNEGTNADTLWALQSNAPIDLGATVLAFGRPLASEIASTAASTLASANAYTDSVSGLPPNDIEYDVILCIGQSNMSGRGGAADARLDPMHDHVYTYDSAGTYTNMITPAQEPLGHLDRVSLGNSLGPALVFARYYADRLPAGRRVLLVPAAYGATGFSTNPSWDPALTGATNNYYDQAVRQSNAAMSAAGAGAQFAAILWHQGEADSSIAGTYQTKLDSLITALRTHITGASATTPFIVGGMVPEYISAAGANAATIAAVHSNTPSRVAYTGYAGGTLGTQNGDNLHYNAVGQRNLGKNMFLAWQSAITNTLQPAVPSQVTGLAAVAGNTTVALTWSAPTSIGSTISDYVIQYRVTGSSTWLTFADGTSTATNATVSGLTNDASYDFHVAASNATGTGPFSSTEQSTPSNVTTIASDSFNRADSLTNPGSTDFGSKTWVQTNVANGSPTTNWGISSNRLSVQSGGINSSCTIDSGFSDHTVQATLIDGGSAIPGVLFWGTDASNFYFVFPQSIGYQITMCNAGTFSQIGTTGPISQPGDVIKVKTSGNSVSVYINGSLWQTVSRGAVAAGTRVGFARNSSGSGVFKFADNFSVTTP